MLNIKIFKHDFFKASTVVLAGSLLANVLNYFFNLVMGRMLEPSEFGEVASLMGLAVIVSVPSLTLIRLMAKYTAGFRTREDFDLIGDLFKLVTRYSLIIGLIMLLIFWLATPLLSSFFRIDKLPFFIFGLILPFSLVAAVNQGTFQGLQRFLPFSLISVIGAAAKLILAALFVKLGFLVAGVMGAYVIGLLFACAYGLFKIVPQLKILKSKDSGKAKSKICQQDILSDVFALFLASLFIALFSNADIVLAKHYLTPYLAGQYAALSVTGKIILYGSASFVTVMFPMISAAKANGGRGERKLLKMSFVVIAAVAGLILSFFFLFPKLTLGILFGVKYLTVAPYLGLFGLAMAFSTLAQVLINYFMASRAKRFLPPLILIVVLQILLIGFFHASLFQITMVMLASSFLLLAVMGVVYYKQAKIKVYESS